MPPPRKAYQPEKPSEELSTVKVLKFLFDLVDGTSDPKCNAAYLQVMAEVNSGRLDA